MNPPESPSKALTPVREEIPPPPPARFGRGGVARATDPVLHPATGELLDLAYAEDVELAKQRADVIELKSRLSEYAAALDQELIARMDRNNVRSMDAGPYHVKVPAPDLVEWDTAQLTIVLTALIESDLLSQTAARKALETRVEYKARATELKKLLNHADPEIRAAIGACRHERPNLGRRVSVSNHQIGEAL